MADGSYHAGSNRSGSRPARIAAHHPLSPKPARWASVQSPFGGTIRRQRPDRESQSEAFASPAGSSSPATYQGVAAAIASATAGGGFRSDAEPSVTTVAEAPTNWLS